MKEFDYQQADLLRVCAKLGEFDDDENGRSKKSFVVGEKCLEGLKDVQVREFVLFSLTIRAFSSFVRTRQTTTYPRARTKTNRTENVEA